MQQQFRNKNGKVKALLNALDSMAGPMTLKRVRASVRLVERAASSPSLTQKAVVLVKKSIRMLVAETIARMAAVFHHNRTITYQNLAASSRDLRCIALLNTEFSAFLHEHGMAAWASQKTHIIAGIFQRMQSRHTVQQELNMARLKSLEMRR